MLYASTKAVHLRRLILDNRLAELDISTCYPPKVIDFAIDQTDVVDVINDVNDKQALR